MKPTVKSLTAELEAARAQITALTQKLESNEQENANLRRGQTQHETEMREVNEAYQRAKEALDPFKCLSALEAAGDWIWPDASIEVIRPITFGQLKAASDAASTLT